MTENTKKSFAHDLRYALGKNVHEADAKFIGRSFDPRYSDINSGVSGGLMSVKYAAESLVGPIYEGKTTLSDKEKTLYD